MRAIKENAKRNRRQRKKLYLDEFTVNGLYFQLTVDSDVEVQENFVDELTDFVDTNEMYGTGTYGIGDKAEFWVFHNERYASPTDEQAASLKGFLEKHGTVKAVENFKSINVNYPEL